MSAPFWEPTVRGAISEIISGKSALNMEPDPIAVASERYAEGPVFLTESDRWVRHAYEHFGAAVAILNSVSRRMDHGCHGVHCAACDKRDADWHAPDLMADLYEGAER